MLLVKKKEKFKENFTGDFTFFLTKLYNIIPKVIGLISLIDRILNEGEKKTLV